MKKVYPHKCPKCNAPARNFGRLICSNTRCKSWQNIKKRAVNHKPSIIEYGLTSDDPITPRCPECKTEETGGWLNNIARCIICEINFPFTFEHGRWYRAADDYEENITLLNDRGFWDLDTQIRRTRN